jgi:hypothetical protein
MKKSIISRNLLTETSRFSYESSFLFFCDNFLTQCSCHNSVNKLRAWFDCLPNRFLDNFKIFNTIQYCITWIQVQKSALHISITKRGMAPNVSSGVHSCSVSTYAVSGNLAHAKLACNFDVICEFFLSKLN